MRTHGFAGCRERLSLADERWGACMTLQADRTITVVAVVLCLVCERNGTRDCQQKDDDDPVQRANPSVPLHTFSLRLSPRDVKAALIRACSRRGTLAGDMPSIS